MWTLNDIIAVRKQNRSIYGAAERAFYKPLAEWLKKENPVRTLYIDPSATGIDVICDENGVWAGYEVKIPSVDRKSSLNFLPLFEGIGQALHYFSRGMDYAFLVCPYPFDYDLSLIEPIKETPVGLIAIEKNGQFTKLVEGRKTSHTLYSEENQNFFRNFIKEVHKTSKIRI